MKKITMVKKVEYFCDICGKNITDDSKNKCEMCGRAICNACYDSVRGWKDMWLTICPICKPMFPEVKDKMNIDYDKHDDLHKKYCGKLYTELKEKSLKIEDKTSNIP